MKAQSFQVTIRISAQVESAGKPYLTEHRVKTQIEKFLKHHDITDGLPCHGAATMRVTNVIEDSPIQED